MVVALTDDGVLGDDVVAGAATDGEVRGCDTAATVGLGVEAAAPASVAAVESVMGNSKACPPASSRTVTASGVGSGSVISSRY